MSGGGAADMRGGSEESDPGGQAGGSGIAEGNGVTAVEDEFDGEADELDRERGETNVKSLGGGSRAPDTPAEAADDDEEPLARTFAVAAATLREHNTHLESPIFAVNSRVPTRRLNTAVVPEN